MAEGSSLFNTSSRPPLLHTGNLPNVQSQVTVNRSSFATTVGSGTTNSIGFSVDGEVLGALVGLGVARIGLLDGALDGELLGAVVGEDVGGTGALVGS